MYILAHHHITEHPASWGFISPLIYYEIFFYIQPIIFHGRQYSILKRLEFVKLQTDAKWSQQITSTSDELKINHLAENCFQCNSSFPRSWKSSSLTKLLMKYSEEAILFFFFFWGYELVFTKAHVLILYLPK